WARVKVGPLPANPANWSRRMSTGGSTSVRTSYEILRKAGASARAMLIGAASCHTEPGSVTHPESGRRIAYGALADKAAIVAVPADPPLKDPKDFRILNTRVRRRDTPSKVNGSAEFGIDVRMPGMLFASVERSPVFGGKVLTFDAAAAKALPGVR